ncbi:hypothetical protein H9Q69_012845 [Fusarium xylarioides]|uniref:Uncharacterized protein n=1 Tax=Fusarium xylarioides TaxID=221167 RepID=A0A9P7HXS1_9HYPO|nr:hypothetical protein H9Q70_014092 [Fusarium xylarioides]KAG5769079.1 hypothetical protein H9Q72_003554 [Fusarium xylarioides]KAG5782517.1 hypothetical protein H9Q73_003818 [Fusarium xylarioides]KAG5788080.1 hypothetical protein H9Q69_012845 [Fusarium xylarioides]
MSVLQTELPSLAGKTCLITGGAGGLGKAIAVAFLKAGSNVVICDINEERVEQAEAELQGMGSLLAKTVDITSLSQVQQLFHEIYNKFTKLDILINNAAIMDRFEPVGDVNLDLWDKVLTVNLTAPLVLSKLAVQGMLQRESINGSIINIASGSAKAGWLAGTAYTASKHGLIGLTKSTAAFYGTKGIRCNALMLGIIGGTNLNDAFTAGVHAEGRQKLGEILSGVRPLPCDVKDVAELCVSLASGPGWNVVNGGVIAVDHGWTSTVG